MKNTRIIFEALKASVCNEVLKAHSLLSVLVDGFVWPWSAGGSLASTSCHLF